MTEIIIKLVALLLFLAASFAAAVLGGCGPEVKNRRETLKLLAVVFMVLFGAAALTDDLTARMWAALDSVAGMNTTIDQQAAACAAVAREVRADALREAVPRMAGRSARRKTYL
jgi:hypothetical protein